jgi:hypothetical protein
MGCAYGHEVHLLQIPLFRSTEYFFSIGNIVLIPNPVHTLFVVLPTTSYRHLNQIDEPKHGHDHIARQR